LFPGGEELPEAKQMNYGPQADRPHGVRRSFMSPVLSKFVVPVTSVYRVEADGVEVFYRAAGDPSAPVLLLLHGFPTSSFMFRELIPRLADQYRVIAPDLPGFGFTEVPEKREYEYSFEALAHTLEAFTDVLGLNRYAIYVFDYGAPTGFRLAMRHPERITAVISQNGDAYEEGLGDAWGPIRKYWAAPTVENREVLRQNVLTLEEAAGSTRTARRIQIGLHLSHTHWMRL
jgi:pimeloyl-ACP methyl ester carboxylesterase